MKLNTRLANQVLVKYMLIISMMYDVLPIFGYEGLRPVRPGLVEAYRHRCSCFIDVQGRLLSNCIIGSIVTSSVITINAVLASPDKSKCDCNLQLYILLYAIKDV